MNNDPKEIPPPGFVADNKVEAIENNPIPPEFYEAMEQVKRGELEPFTGDTPTPQSAVEWAAKQWAEWNCGGGGSIMQDTIMPLARRCYEAEQQVKRYDEYHSKLITENESLCAQLAAAQAEAAEMRKQRDMAGKQVLTLTAEINRLRKGITEIKAGTRIGWFMTDLGAKCEKLLNP